MRLGSNWNIKRLYTSVYEFFSEKWIETHEESKASFLEKFAHFCLLVLKSFLRNKCPLRATALAYATLLALVPLLAVGVSITSGLLQERGRDATRDLIERFVDAVVPQLKEVPRAEGETEDARTQVVGRINEFIANIQAKTLGASGILGLILVAILLLSNIEDTFNDIWGVTRGRSWFKRVVQYWTTISLGPIALVAGVVLFTSNYMDSTEGFIQRFGFLGLFLKALPFVFITIAFALLYKVMPNTQVHWVAAIIGGVVGGGFWLTVNHFSAIFASRVFTMSKIYGTALAIIPIFLIGLYFSWLIVLLGSQVAYAYQNRVVYVQEKKAENVSQRGREYVAFRLMALIAQRFDIAARPPSLLEISTRLGVPSRLVGRVIQPLCESSLIHAVAIGNEEGYAPARPLEAITCHDIINTLRSTGGQLDTREDASRPLICAEFERIYEGERERAAAVTLKELVTRMNAEGISEPKDILPFKHTA
jgi:membrane protein